jgi:GDP-L-fucose synthase
VGSAVLRALKARGCEQLILRTHGELDLTDHPTVLQFFNLERPQAVIMAAARVGGILANNSHPARFLRDNLLDNVIDAAYRSGVEKLVFLGSSCIYPKMAPQPIKEGYLLTGPLEPTNEWYDVAKIAGIKMCQAYRREYGFNAISLMPTNLYGPGDNFDLQNSHVLPALIADFTRLRFTMTLPLPFGVRERRVGNSSMSMISPMRCCIFCRTMTLNLSSMLAGGRT